MWTCQKIANYVKDENGVVVRNASDRHLPAALRRRSGSAVLPATEIKGDRDIFTHDMMMMRLYSTDQ